MIDCFFRLSGPLNIVRHRRAHVNVNSLIIVTFYETDAFQS